MIQEENVPPAAQVSDSLKRSQKQKQANYFLIAFIVNWVQSLPNLYVN